MRTLIKARTKCPYCCHDKAVIKRDYVYCTRCKRQNPKGKLVRKEENDNGTNT